MVRLIAPFIIGLLIGLGQPPWPATAGWFLAAGALLAHLSSRRRYHFRHRWVFGAYVYAWLTAFGIFWVSVVANRSIQSSLPETTLEMVGKVETMKPSANGKWWRAEISMKAVKTIEDGRHLAAGHKALIYLEVETDALPPRYGDLLHLRTKLQPIEAPLNPSFFDTKRYWNDRDVYWQAFVRKDRWKVCAGDPAGIEGWRQHLLERLRVRLPDTSTYSVVSAMLLGSRDAISPEIRAAYADTGALHVLAVSGLHVGLIYLLLEWLLVRTRLLDRLGKYPKFVILAGGIWAYALLTGGSPSVCRAATLFSFFLFGQTIDRRAPAINLLAGSALLLLLTEPNWIRQAGFQLSYAAVGGILLLQGPLERSWASRWKLIDYAWRLTTVSIAAQIFTLPITLFHFQRFPLYFWLSGLLVIPLAPLVLGGGILLLLLDALFPPLCPLVGKGLQLIIHMMNTGIEGIQHLPGAVVETPFFQTIEIVLLYLILAAVLLAWHQREKKWVLIALAGLILWQWWGLARDYRQRRQQQLAIYYVPNGIGIDLFLGKEAQAFSDSGTDEDRFIQASRDHRKRNGVYRIQARQVDTSGSFLLSCWDAEGRTFLLDDRRIGWIYRRLPTIEPISPSRVDDLLISREPMIEWKKWNRCYSFRRIVADGSNSWKYLQELREECSKQGVELYELGQDGALLIEH